MNPILLHQLTPTGHLLPGTIHRGLKLRHKMNPILLHQLTPTGHLLPGTIHRGLKLRHKMNPILLQQLTLVGQLLPRTIRRGPTEQQDVSCIPSSTHTQEESPLSSYCNPLMSTTVVSPSTPLPLAKTK